MSGNLYCWRIASSRLITSASTLILESFARCTSRDWSIKSRRTFFSFAAICARNWSGVQFWHSSWTSPGMIARACCKSSRVMTSLFTRATISSTITLFVCALTIPARRKKKTISHLFCFIGDFLFAGFSRRRAKTSAMATARKAGTRLLRSLSLRFQGKQHVSDTFGDPAAPLDAHPESSSRVQAHPLAFGPDEPDQFFGRQSRLRVKFDGHFVGAALNRRDQNPFGQPLQQCIVEKVPHGRGRGAKAVGQFAVYFFPFGVIRDSRNAFVRSQPQVLVRDVLLWDANIEPEVDCGAHLGLRLLAFQGGYRSLHHLAVEVKSDRVDVAVLLASEQVSGASKFQVERGDAESRSESAEFLERGEPTLGQRRERDVLGNQQVRVCALIGTPDASAELVQLGKAEAVRAIDENRVGTWNIEAIFDNGRGNKDIGFIAHEFQHYGFKLFLIHLAVPHDDTRLRDELIDQRGDGVDGLDPIVDEENLAVARQLFLNRAADQGFGKRGDDGLNR